MISIIKKEIIEIDGVKHIKEIYSNGASSIYPFTEKVENELEDGKEVIEPAVEEPTLTADDIALETAVNVEYLVCLAELNTI